jgi:beta-lactamase superfamily II metal-dependent hydrolase
MTAQLSFFSVDNGDMTLVITDSGKRVLIDCNIRDVTGDDPPPDVLKQIKERLLQDSDGRYYVDAFLLSHPDLDHCRGFESHFYCGKPEDFPKKSEKIFIRELWSSPMIFRRKQRHETLSPDAEAFNREARRRVQHYRDTSGAVSHGDRILIFGEDQDNKQAGVEAIVVKAGNRFQTICGEWQSNFSAFLLAPASKGTDDDEELRSKNNSSVILQMNIGSGTNADACRFLCGGDAGYAIWERLWQKYKDNTDVLTYDVLLTPHHCSWHSLSADSISELGDKAKVSKDARSALSQGREYGRLIASCKPIDNDDDDPPSYRAKQEYDSIRSEFRGRLYETSDYRDPPFELEVGVGGPSPKSVTRTSVGVATSAIGASVLSHGSPRH